MCQEYESGLGFGLCAKCIVNLGEKYKLNSSGSEKLLFS